MENKNKKQEKTKVCFYVDNDVYRKFKIKCIENGEKLSIALERLIVQSV